MKLHIHDQLRQSTIDEAGIEYSLERINDISLKCPNICKVSPSSNFHMEDVDLAGGVSAILNEISKSNVIFLPFGF